ncbi:class I SAM-dependent methyltransferase, partial [Fulvivirga sp. RKSG066]|uniref:SAM-dependent methyltransferase n=1 Tax=Fulvivirga aurantia TaxID=2529383 RepID=UPI0012BC6FC5
MSQETEWFDEWFDSPYYHILYKHRDYEEAKGFLDTLIRFFKIKPNHKVLDLACGKGRHSIYLNEKGFDVVGVDLSEQNIAHAKKFENDSLHFDVHDMREVYAEERFDFVLNMFTSFGYFDSEKENEQAICAAAKSLKPGGSLLIDFLNPYRVINNLVPEEKKTIEGIEFDITR